MKKKKYRTTNKISLNKHRKKLKRTAGLVMDVGVAGMMVQTAKGLK